MENNNVLSVFRVIITGVLLISCVSCDLFNNAFAPTDLKNLYKNSGLVLEYLFSGNANDTSGNNQNGTFQGGTPVLSNDRNGNANRAYTFNGTSNYIDCGNSPKLNPTDQISVCAWYKPTISFAGAGFDPIVGKAYTSHVSPFYQYQLGVTGDTYSSSQCKFGFAVTTTNYAFCLITTPNNYWTFGNWYFITGTYDGSNIRLYVNGNLITSNPLTGKMIDYGNNVLIGKYANVACCLPGIIDNVRIYNRALSTAEIQILYSENK
jgi:hypothetical protein